MMNSYVSRARPVILAALIVGIISVAQGQSIRFPGGAAPVITAPSVQGVDGNGRPATIMDAGTSRQFAASYNATGRLSSLKSTAGSNAFDLNVIHYTPDGHLQSVYFGNHYQIFFRYRSDGAREVVDSLGGTIVQDKTSSGQFLSNSVVDPSDFLVPSLRLLGGLFSEFSKVTGMSAAY
jgi:hypothetical protein